MRVPGHRQIGVGEAGRGVETGRIVEVAHPVVVPRGCELERLPGRRRSERRGTPSVSNLPRDRRVRHLLNADGA